MPRKINPDASAEPGVSGGEETVKEGRGGGTGGAGAPPTAPQFLHV